MLLIYHDICLISLKMLTRYNLIDFQADLKHISDITVLYRMRNEKVIYSLQLSLTFIKQIY